MRCPFSYALPLCLVLATAVTTARADTSPVAPAPAILMPAPKSSLVKILVMDIAAAGLDASIVENISGLVAVLLTEDVRLDVLSGADIKQMAALEGEKQALGCTNDASCLADVAGAMGAGLIIYGNGGQLGTLLNINLNVFDAIQARSVGRVALQAKSLEELPEKLRPAILQLIAKAIGAPAPTTAPTTATATATATATTVEAPRGPSVLPVVGIVSGSLLAVLGIGGVVVGALPAADLAQAEDDFLASKGDDAARRRALSNARDVREEWYDNNLAPGLLVGGVAVGVVGLALVGVSALMMEGGE